MAKYPLETSKNQIKTPNPRNLKSTSKPHFPNLKNQKKIHYRGNKIDHWVAAKRFLFSNGVWWLVTAQGRNGGSTRQDSDNGARQEWSNHLGLEHAWSFDWCHGVAGGSSTQTQNPEPASLSSCYISVSLNLVTLALVGVWGFLVSKLVWWYQRVGLLAVVLVVYICNWDCEG